MCYHGVSTIAKAEPVSWYLSRNRSLDTEQNSLLLSVWERWPWNTSTSPTPAKPVRRASHATAPRGGDTVAVTVASDATVTQWAPSTS